MDIQQFFFNGSEWFLSFGSSWVTIICFPTIIAILSALIIVVRMLSASSYPRTNTSVMVTKEEKVPIVLENILNRRTIFPKDCRENQVLKKTELETILEAANWAPTHNKTEPWRYIVFQGSSAISSYLDFLEDYYQSIEDKITENELEKFRKKMSGARKDWPDKCCALIIIAMKRQQPDEGGNRMPEWEEISAVAMSVQNMHLIATSMEDIAGFWSSHTWCKRARDSHEMRKFLNLENDEDRVFGAFLLGRYDSNKRFRSSRNSIWQKVQIRND